MHINAMSVSPDPVETVQDIGSKRVRDAVESNELLDASNLSVEASLRLVQSVDNNGHIAKDTGIY